MLLYTKFTEQTFKLLISLTYTYVYVSMCMVRAIVYMVSSLLPPSLILPPSLPPYLTQEKPEELDPEKAKNAREKIKFVPLEYIHVCTCACVLRSVIVPFPTRGP